jgi:hypothetical protein
VSISLGKCGNTKTGWYLFNVARGARFDGDPLIRRTCRRDIEILSDGLEFGPYFASSASDSGWRESLSSALLHAGIYNLPAMIGSCHGKLNGTRFRYIWDGIGCERSSK